jgi:translation initiation factor 2 subunit 3
MNKIDLIKKNTAYEQIEKIKKYVQTLSNTSSCPPIIPISATFNINIDVVCHLLSQLKIPKERDPMARFKMIVIRSFDVNKPGSDITKLHGGVIGGTIMRGLLKVGDRINIYPGMTKAIPHNEKKDDGADFKYEPISGEVITIKSDMNELDYAIPGGLLGIQLTIDAAFTRNDRLAGSLVLKTNDVKLAENKNIDDIVKVFDKIIVKINTLLVEQSAISDLLKTKPPMMINVNSNNIDCTIYKYIPKRQELYLCLKKPIAIDSSENLATIMRKNKKINDILGRGIIIDGIKCERM